MYVLIHRTSISAFPTALGRRETFSVPYFFHLPAFPLPSSCHQLLEKCRKITTTISAFRQKDGIHGHQKSRCLSGRHLQRVCFLCLSPSRTFQAEREAKKDSDNDADHKRKKDYDGKRRAEFPHKKRNRDRCCILNGKNDNGCYNNGCIQRISMRDLPLHSCGQFCRSSGQVAQVTVIGRAARFIISSFI